MARLLGIVLAAGHGRRMGGAKALLEIGGRALALRHVERLLEVGCASVIVVVRPETARALSRRLHDPRVSIRIAWTASQAESLAEALRLLPASSGDTLFITPVDMLPADVSTHHALVNALTGTTLAATPTFGGRGGHPVLVQRSVLVPYETAGPDLPPLNEVLASTTRARVEVTDETILGDLDTPSDVAKLAATYGLSLAR